MSSHLITLVSLSCAIQLKVIKVTRGLILRTAFLASSSLTCGGRCCSRPPVIFMANTIGDNLWCAASPGVSTRLLGASSLLVSTSETEAGVGILMISREIKCSRSAGGCVYVRVFGMYVRVHLAVRIKPLSPVQRL